MAENQRIGLLQAWERPVSTFDHFADEGFADAIGCSTDFRPSGMVLVLLSGYQDLFASPLPSIADGCVTAAE